MGSLVMSKNVPSTPETLFEAIVRPEGWGRWLSIHRSFVHQPPEILSEGATLVSRVVLLGQEHEVEWTVESLDAPHRVILLGTSRAGVRSEFTYWLRPFESGTTLTVGGAFTAPHITTSTLSRELEDHARDVIQRTLEQLEAVVTTAP